jgi:hypothetical protein
MSENAPEQIGPQPVPQSITVGGARDGAQGYVVVQISGPTGVHVTFLPPDTAVSLADQIAAAARQVKTGLVVASGLEQINGNGRH